MTSLSWAILAIWKICWNCYGNLQNCCCLPTAERASKFGLLRSTQCILTVEMRLTGRVVVVLLSWRRTGGAVSDFLVNSCHHNVANIRARVLCCLATEGASSRMKNTLGVGLICAKCVPGRLRIGLELAGSWESHQDVTTHLICSFLSYWTLATTSLWLFPHVPQKLELCSPHAMWEHSRFVLDCY